MRNLLIYLAILGCFGCSLIKNYKGRNKNSDTIIYKSSEYDIKLQPISQKDSYYTEINSNESGYRNRGNFVGFKISLLNKGTISIPDYDSFIKFYSFDFGNYIKLISGKDTIACKYFESERHYDISPIFHVFAFFELEGKKLKQKEGNYIILNKNSYFNSDDIAFKLNSSQLK